MGIESYSLAKDGEKKLSAVNDAVQLCVQLTSPL